ncbi:NapC/NirT family cytochrome c [Neobacillus sp. PS3-40]|uniref:cytochrome c3 family protein n=1 Tax=Neobacillus sp. PS3-40 TaxID=3070679 RepID=UPI0027E1F250|nr:NapC/NirT family cytochrome c [Neobacillus sp. PS3-40]WML46053.1 NapC/NirT family cytochrome c [Neobacillus sp. PS3-40]
MEEEHNELPTPPRFRYKLLKIATLTLLILALFASIGFTGLEATSSSKFCSSCHEMKPEYYTWKASTHAEVDCVNCHTQPGAENIPKDKANVIVQAFKKETNTYTAPIHMPSDIPNSACERCHNVSTREVTPSGDLIIPHDKHNAKGIECIQCHSGVAHGKIADRKMTYQTDYDKWDDTIGTAAMSDTKFIRPEMDTCMECHKARDVSTACKTCHTTGMVPKSHTNTFKTMNHGKYAEKNIRKCDSCHGYMSKVKIDGLEDVSAVTKFLENMKTSKPSITPFDYAKQNTFCKNCHSKRPASHTSHWIADHHNEASKNTKQCLACHNYQPGGKYQTKTVACSSCHPSSHIGFNREGHPIPLATKNQKVTNLCYTCHVKPKCSACHKDS